MTAFTVTVKDFGEIQNRVLGRRYYKPGEIMQAHVQIGDRHVWIEHNRYHTDTPYRVAFGVVPGYVPLVSLAEARTMLERFLDAVPCSALVEAGTTLDEILGEVPHADILDA